MRKRSACAGGECAVAIEEHWRLDLDARQSWRIRALVYSCQVALETVLKIGTARPGVMPGKDAARAVVFKAGEQDIGWQGAQVALLLNNDDV